MRICFDGAVDSLPFPTNGGRLTLLLVHNLDMLGIFHQMLKERLEFNPNHFEDLRNVLITVQLSNYQLQYIP